MTKNKYARTRVKSVRSSASTGSMSVSRIYSLSKLVQSKATSGMKKSVFVERKALDAKTCIRENQDLAVHKNVAFYSPSLIRIRATDREGNSMEVTYYH